MLVFIPLFAYIIAIFLIRGLYGHSWRRSFLFTSIGFGVYAACVTEFLSWFHAFHRWGIAICWGVVLLGVCAFYFHNRKKVHLHLPVIRFDRHLWAEYLLLFGVLLLVAINTWVAWQTPPNNWDSMVYHLPRIEHWLHNQSIAFYPSHINRQLFLNPWLEYCMAQGMSLMGSDRIVNGFGIFFWVGVSVLASELAKMLGANQRGQKLAAMVCLFIPTNVLQATTTKNDLALAFWVLSAILCFLCFRDHRNWQYALGLGASIGLAVLTKTTAYVILAPLVVWFIAWGVKALQWRVLSYGMLIGLVVVLLNAPHALRNYDLYDNPMGPAYETSLYHNEMYGLRVTVSNMARNLAIHLRAFPAWNAMLMDGVETIHQWIGLDVSDVRTTWVGYQFALPALRINEDELGAPLHIGLLVWSIYLMAKELKSAKKEDKTTYLLLLLVVCGFVLFSAYLRWQYWQARLMLTFFVLSSVVIGKILGAKLPSTLNYLLASVLVLSGFLCVWKNPTKPLPVFYDYNITNMPRSLVMIYDLQLQPDYMKTVEVFKNELHCDQIGIIMDNADWEYPLWALLAPYYSENLRLEHVNVQNESARLMDSGFNPCAVLNFTTERPELLPVDDDGMYAAYLSLEELTIYIPGD